MKQLSKRTMFLTAVVLVLLAPAYVMAQRQSGDRTPTAPIDQPPREVEGLTWERKANRQHSVLDGGAAGTLPVDRVVLPDLCEVMPDHPSCDDDPGDQVGYPKPVDPGPTDPTPHLPMRCDCPGMAVMPGGGFIRALEQFPTVRQCNAVLMSGKYPGPLECSSYSITPSSSCVSLHINRNFAMREVECTMI